MTNPPGPPPALPAPPTRGRSATGRRAWPIALGAVLALALAAVAVLVVVLVQTSDALREAEDRLDRQDRQLREQQDRLDELGRQLDEKQVFGEAMGALMATVRRFDGAPTASLVDFDRLDELARLAWEHRHDVTAVQRYTADARALDEELATVLADAAARTTNASGTTAEQVIDALGRGFVETVWGDAAEICEADALGCVWSGDPYVIHLDRDGFAQPYRTDWGERLVAHHEFAHVLQFTNPDPTAEAIDAFDDDNEAMADCYALTKLDAWSLQERVWLSNREYWDVTYGYGRVCDESQRQVIRDWVADSGVAYRPVSQ